MAGLDVDAFLWVHSGQAVERTYQSKQGWGTWRRYKVSICREYGSQHPAGLGAVGLVGVARQHGGGGLGGPGQGSCLCVPWRSPLLGGGVLRRGLCFLAYVAHWKMVGYLFLSVAVVL